MKILYNICSKNKVKSLNKTFLFLFLLLSSFTIYATVPPPGVTKDPNVATVCRSSALKVNLSGIPVSGCTCSYQQQYMLPGESTWTSMAIGAAIAPSIAGVAQIRARIACTGSAGCDTSAWTTVSWNVVDLPSIPGTITRFPDSDICLGATASATASGSTGGTGSCYYLYTFFHSGRTQGGYSTVNTYNSDTISTLYVKARFYCDGYGCDTSNYASSSWSIVPDPLAPSLVKNPNLDSVCVGASVTVNSTTNTGGTGVCNDLFRYSDNGGTTWSAWSTSIPVVSVVNPGQIVKIQGKKECDGPGCNSSDTSQVSWKGISDPLWGTVSLSQDSLCNGGNVILSASTTGGSGGTIQWYRYYTTPSYTVAPVSSPNTPPSPRTYYYYPSYTPFPINSGCNLDTGTNIKLVVVADPSWTAISVTPANDCIGASVNLSVTLNGGLGGASASWIRDTVSGGSGATVTNPDVPATPDTYYYRPHYNPPVPPRGCNLSDGAQRTVNIYPLPTAQTITGTPAGGSTVCIGTTISATFSGGTNSIGSEINEYQYSTNGGSTWNTYTPGNNITTTQVGTNIIQIRTRKAASGTSCYSDWNVSMWSVSPNLAAPSLNTKTPNIPSVCAGTMVNATLNPGSGGVGCSDVIEYSINNGVSWNPYTSGQSINTTTASEVIIHAYRGNCDPISGCTNTSTIELARWSVTPSVTAATMTPTGGQVCSGTSVAAAVDVAGSGGFGCSDVFQSRYRSSGVWSSWISYSPGNNISSTGRDSIQIRSLRSCDPLSGCADTNLYSWVVNNYTVVSPTLAKSPNVATVCDGTSVLATLLTPGSGGNGCSDYYEYRINNGAWSAWMSYTLGTGITTTGLSGVEIRTWRANCLPGGICGDSTINIYSWTVVAQTSDPNIARYPISSIICNSDTVRGTITFGTGGTGCTNYAQYRIKTGAIWSTWYAYTSGQNILANGRTEIEIKAWTGNCTASAGCLSSDTAIESWTISPNLVNPTLTRTPNRTSICEEEFASAILNTAGSGGTNCSDIFEYRTNNGTWSGWSPYTLGTNIPGTGLSSIEIQGYRGNCDPGTSCNTPTPYVLSWTVVATATAPTITRIPDQDEICSGTSVSATIVAGSGGISCFDYHQYRYYNGTAWSAWTSYTSGTSISTTGRTVVQVRTFRGCQPTTGCVSTDTTLVEWDVVTGITHPTMNKIPALDTVCQGVTISATIATAGSGGIGCSDIYEYRINTSGIWGGWNPYTPGNAIPTDVSTEGVEVRATHTNCSSGIVCGSSTANTYSWVVVPLPIAPGITRVPNSDYLCSGQTASVTTTPGSGYSCSDYFQYRRYNGTTWSAWTFYPAGYNIPSTGYQTIEVRGFNRNCNSSSGCTPDTTVVAWTVSPTIVAPTLTKTPNVSSFCQGYNVSAVLAGGSGGIGCSNMAEYTLDGGTTWLAYTSGTPIATSGVSTVTIRAFRDNCNPLVPCPSSDTVSVSWTVSDQPIAPVLTRVPDVDLICQGASVSATVVAGSGGVSCTDYYKYRVHNGTSWSVWTAYITGSNISTTGRTQIEVMAYRSCSGTGCDGTDTSLVHWNVDATIVNPILNKLPNLASVCDGTDVSATIASAGSGGNGCSDIIESSVDGGLTWSPYTTGTLINTSSLTSVMIRAYRGNCITGGCSPTDTNTLVWTIILAPIEPIITKSPNTNDICYGATVSATITPGTGGTGCSNYSQYRIYNGTTWTTWYNYTSGNNIIYPSNAQTIQIRAFRGNCTSGCGASDTATASWNVIQSMINPILAKNPNTATVVENTDVSATIQVPGSNGNGCMDVLEFRVDIGSGYGPWNAYTAGNLLSTTGLVAIQVRGFRGNCSGGDICPPADTTLYTWSVVQEPQAPDVVRVPDANDVCIGTSLSATITINGGGVGCTDYAQYRTYNGTTWTAWATYISGNNISYPAGSTQVQVRAFRGNCDPLSGDVSSDTTLVSWNIIPAMINPILLKNPNMAAVCAGIDISATIQTPGSGGTSCNDLLEFRADNGSGFSSWQSYIPGDPIPTIGFIQVQVRGFRGGCLGGLICPPADTTIYSWTISAEPIAPTIVRTPDQNDVCQGTALSANITPGTGGSGCTEYYQSRQYNGATWTAWTAYTSGSTIGYGTTITKIEIRAFRGNCDISSGCTSSDTSSVFWNILPGLTRPIIAKNPELNAICEGVNVSATVTTPGSGGVGCSDVMEYRTNNGSGFGAWTAYSGGTLINTLGLTGVEIRANHENCASGDECPAADTIVSWTITAGPIAPQITRVPNQNSICRETNISATIVPGYGGDGCSDILEYRLYNGSTWSIWIAYPPSSNISYNANTSQIELRGYRSYCDVGTGCTSSDTNIVSWFVTDNLTNPILLKHPNIDSICAGIDVSASIQTPGSGGTGCTDILEYRVNNGSGFSGWFAYGENDLIPTSGYTEVQIRGIIGNCTSGNECPPADTAIYSWMVNPGLTGPVVTKNPDQITVCRGTAVSATITPGSGGNGCTEYYQYRLYNGSSWTSWGAYVSGTSIVYNPSDVQVQIRAFRGNCNLASGCEASDTTLVSWNILEYLVNPVLEKYPDVDAICNVDQVSASISVSGSGGVGCSDILEYRIDAGLGFSAWQPYTSADAIPTAGYTEIQVRGYIGNCISGNECPPADTAIYSWAIQPAPVAPTITRVPNIDDICFGTPLSAIITLGSGGSNCTETAQFRTYNGTVWSAWTAYTSGSNISYSAGITQIEVRAFRGNCNPLSGCLSSDTTIASWNILNNLINPVLTKNPAIATICQGTDVSASIQVPGSGGVGCSDILEYRTNSGSGFGAWLTYVAGDILPTFGLTSIQIRGYIGNCISGSQCPPADTTIYNWDVSIPPTAPIITRNPDLDTICRSTAISATITPGTGGTSCINYSQFRTYNGVTWTAWTAYTSGNNIPYGATITRVQVRAFRGNCDPLSGCTCSDTTLTSWTILNNLVNPILIKNPNTTTICLGTDASATIQTPGSAGAGCTDILEYRTDSGSGFGTWLTYSAGNPIPSTGLTAIQIRGYVGNCISGGQCPPNDTAIYLWNIVDIPQNPDIVRIPDEDNLCTGTAISAIINQNGGGVGCTDYSQYRIYNGATWTAWTGYTSGNNIAYPLGTTQVQVRAFRGNCSAEAGCTASDTIVVFWGINPQPIAPILTKNPDYIGVCEGTSVSATVATPGSGGVGCSDNSEYRIHNGTSWSAWLSYIPGTLITTTGLTQVEIRSWRGACPIAGCNSTDTTLLQWSVNGPATEPTIARIPNLDLICEGTPVSATITSGAGGVGCNDISEYRILNAGIWSVWNNYTSASTLNTSSIDSVEIRTYRICPPVTGCSSTDTNFVAWKVIELVTLPVMTKVPNIAGVCEGSSVSATLTIPGSGGLNCIDTYEYRTNDGSGFSAWTPYIPSNAIATIGLTQIEIRFSRNICDPQNVCTPPDPEIISWFVNPQPTAPLVTRIPDIDNVCNGTILSGTITPGSGGVNCSDTYQYRYFNAGVWSAWMSYNSGNNLSYPATATQAEIRAFRANCEPASSCVATDTALVSWNISLPITAPVMVKNPNIAGVCDGTPVSATLVTPGSGGLNCSDIYEYRTNNGTGFGAWAPYIPGAPIATNGLTEIEIRFGRNACDPLNVCPPPAPEIFYWFVAPQSVAPTIVKNPDTDSLCVGPDLSGTITSGSGGAGCVDVYEYRIQDTLGVWSPWMSYTSNSIIHSSAIRSAQIRISRTNCFPGSGCTEYPPTQIEWIIFPQPIVPVLTRIPDQDAVCETTLLTAIQTGNVGGVPPTTIIYQNENPGEWTWNPGNSFVPNSNGMAYIRARATSNGYGCVDSDWQWVSWIVDPKPVITTPANQTICEGGSTILDALVTGGYGTITYSWEMSASSCTGPWSPIPDSTRASLETGPLSDTTWYRITATQQATSCSDVSPCIAVNVKPAPAVTISGNTIVCSGGTTLTANVTNEPNPATYQWQFSNTATGPWVNTGTNDNTLNIPSVVGSLYYRCTIAGDTIGCSTNSTATLVQLGTVPIISYQSSDTSICNGQNLFLNLSAQAVPSPTYQWYGPLGIIAGATSDTLYVNNVQIGDTGIYYCEIRSFCDTIATSNIHVNIIQNLIDATAISGATHRCQGTGFDLYTHDAQNAHSTTWNITPPEAGTIDSTGLVIWNGNFAGTAQIIAQIQGCDMQTSHHLDVVVDSTVSTPIISGTAIRCPRAGTDQYSAISSGATSFVWSISNAGSSSINNTGLVDWDSTFTGTATIYVYANGCGGPSSSAEYQVVTIDSITLSQSGSQHSCANDSSALWISPSQNFGNSFQWFGQGGEIIGETDTILVFNPITTFDQGAYYCRVITICGDTVFSIPDTVTVHPLPNVDFLISRVCRLDTTHFVNLSTVTDGTISYQWMFGDGTTSTDLNPNHIYLEADTFSVILTATSSWGCSQSFSQQLIIHELPQAIITTIGDSCNNSGKGSVIITPTFGTPPFSYYLSGQFTQLDSIFTPLPAGQYWVTVTDSNNCRITLPAIVTQPNLLKTHIYPNNILCYNDSSGVADLQVTGGTQPYQYIWTNGQTTEDLTDVPIGSYGVLVTDASGCFATDSVTLIQPNPLIVDSLIIQPSCLQLNDGKVFVFVSGGSGIYNYLWSTGSVLDSIINLSPNTYQVTISDANGCKSLHEYIINGNNNDCLTIWTSFSPDGDGTNDVWNIGHIELYPECVVQIFNRWGAQLFESKGYSQPWDGTWNNKALPAETYYYVINLGDDSEPITGTVTIIR